MAQWRLRSPGEFPSSFHAALNFELGEEQVIARFHTKAGAQAAQIKWRLFMFCCRNWQAGQYAGLAAKYIRRTKVAYSYERERWELLVHVRETAGALVKIAEVFEIPLDR